MNTIRAGIGLVSIFISMSSCGDTPIRKSDNDSTLVVSKPIEYPYTFINSKQETRQNDQNYNEMLLYICGTKPDIDTLKLFCASKKNGFSGGIFHIIAFFDNKENSAFPNNPVTGGFNDEKISKHIKAIYTYNRLNGYSKLDYYDKNLWESVAQTEDIN